MNLQVTSDKLYGETTFQSKELKMLFTDLYELKAHIFWVDFLLSATGGWIAFTCACLSKPMSWQMFTFITMAAICLYRAMAFLHELSHIAPNTLPGFAKAWNLFIGIPLLVPSFVYVGVHLHHHRLSSYGTVRDPEYMLFAGKQRTIIFFVVQSIMTPPALILRFLLLSLLGLLIPPFHRFLECHASSACSNPGYLRRMSDEERSDVKVMELLIIAFWVIPIGLSIYGVFPWHVFLVWYGVTVCIETIRCFQALGAHRYQGSGETMDKNSQLLDSIDTPGNFWTVLWAPVGLRYHALHHCFPNIPYHNLHIAYHRLKEYLPIDSFYHKTTSPSLLHSIQTLWSYENYI